MVTEVTAHKECSGRVCSIESCMVSRVNATTSVGSRGLQRAGRTDCGDYCVSANAGEASHRLRVVVNSYSTSSAPLLSLLPPQQTQIKNYVCIAMRHTSSSPKIVRVQAVVSRTRDDANMVDDDCRRLVSDLVQAADSLS